VSLRLNNTRNGRSGSPREDCDARAPKAKETFVPRTLTQTAGKSLLAGLLATADVLVQNLKPGALGRLGFDAKRLARDYPRLIAVSICGYGEGGPMSGRKAYDLLIQADSGMCSITGGPEGPARVGISIVDIATGATAYSSILEALIRRGNTGKGAQISVSMFDVMADWLTVPLLNHEGGKTPKRSGLAHPSIAPYGVFACKDGHQVLISVQSDREWVKRAEVFLGKPELTRDARFATNVARVANRAATDAEVAAGFASRT
jgi:itaconate CoA-transferase